MFKFINEYCTDKIYKLIFISAVILKERQSKK